MDGLMIDSERVALACWSEAADEFGLGLDKAVFLRMVGLGDRDTHALLRAQGIEDSVIEAVAARCHDLRTRFRARWRPPRGSRAPTASWPRPACCRTSMR
ncbi:hypothetical protein G6F64_014696 [Rhizopus arrhizus]|uniref:Uncharacterized protein n=1 Tax=Rhizopus oryzae TaxID=64495 RepID=A0A9P6WSY1_RHIOR|nr:hypothetical protein G6F64_014696 [Rhizopus arrhizus]